MDLVYHTHTPIVISKDQVLAPRFLAKEVNAISKKKINLVLVVYEAIEEEKVLCKSVLSGDIELVLLGAHNSVVARLIRSPISLYRFYKALKSKKNPSLLIKGPTPLLLFLFVIQRFANIYVFLVGDYTSNLTSLNFGYAKNIAIKNLAFMVDFSIKYMYKKAALIVNSDVLYNKYKNFYIKTSLIRTSTICKDEILNSRFYSKSQFNILFVGRVDYSKGVYELVDAFVNCYSEGIVQRLDVVGPIVNNGQNVQERVVRDFKENKAFDHVHFLGPVYDEEILREKFLNADIFVLPSKSEGFPRVFWEAFAAGVPVITTKVGGIPMVLENKKHAMLLENSEKNSIIKAIQILKYNSVLFHQIVNNARELASSNTIEHQIDKLIDFIYE